MTKVNSMGTSLLDTNGQNSGMRSSNQNNRIYWNAVVTSVDDPLQQNRIVCRIINLDQNGNILGGKDRDIQDAQLVLCIPFSSSYFISSPLVGEMVTVMQQDPNDSSSPRIWIGPLFSSMLNARSELYRSAVKINDKTSFNLNKSIQNNVLASAAFPSKSDVAVLGRGDSAVILRDKELYMYASAFLQGTFTPNPDVAYIDIKQYSGFTQTNVVADSINVYSTKGKFMSAAQAKFENNQNLSSLNSLAQNLQPMLLGCSVLECLNLIIQVLLTHVHNIETPLVPTQLSKSLSAFSLNGRLQELISSYCRVN